MNSKLKDRYMRYYEQAKAKRGERSIPEKEISKESHKESILKKLKELKEQEFILHIPVGKNYEG